CYGGSYNSTYAPPVFGSALGMSYDPYTGGPGSMATSGSPTGTTASGVPPAVPSEVTSPVTPTPVPPTPVPPTPTTPSTTTPPPIPSPPTVPPRPTT
ncbi:MAG: hypothetical protein ACLQGP_26575, partial [Isosphaeraceae bacterium]